MRGSAMLIQWEEEEKSGYENSKKIKVFLREKRRDTIVRTLDLTKHDE